MRKGKRQMKYWKFVSATIILVLSASANATLIERLGGLAYYDDQLNITWLADANNSMTSGYDDVGLMTWEESMTWAQQLSIGGVTDWRLASMNVNNDNIISDCSISSNSQSDCADNEYGHLYYYGGGSTHGSGITPENENPFSNIQSNLYWSSTDRVDVDTSAWIFRFLAGDQRSFNISADLASWAVHDGDIGMSVVPVPAAVWLFGSGLIVLVGFTRAKKA